MQPLPFDHGYQLCLLPTRSRMHAGSLCLPALPHTLPPACVAAQCTPLLYLPHVPCSYEGLVKEDKCHVRGVFKYSNGDR